MRVAFPLRTRSALARLRPDALWAAFYLPLALLFTWPLAAHLTDRLAGDQGDDWQTLWGFEWVRSAVLAGKSPFFTHRLWHPTGVTLVFQTFDLPDALIATVLRTVVGPWTAFNLVVLFIYAASGATMYALGRSLGASRPAAFFSGCAYTFSTFHFGHALGHVHILAMQWMPLYVLCFLRVLDGARWRWAFLGGALLVVCSLSSWYYLLGAFIVSVGLLVAKVVREHGNGWKSWVPRAAVLCLTYLVLIAPLGIAMLRARAAEPIGGEHAAWFFSADLQSFFLPNAASAVSGVFTRWRSWTGNPAENASYLGYLLVAFGLVGLVLRAPRVGGFLLAALLGVVLSLGPSLHVGGRVMLHDALPYAWIVKHFPLLNFMGVPVRLGFAATFGLAAALAPTLDALVARFSWKAMAPLAALAVLEHTPHVFVTSSFPTPEPMLSWASDSDPFAVLDACRDMRPLWHAVLHGHSILGGYLTRTPERLEDALHDDPVAGPLLAWDAPDASAPISLRSLDLPFTTPIAPGAEPTHFSFEAAGPFVVPADAAYTFTVTSDDAASLAIDGRIVVDNGGAHPPRDRQGTVQLTAGTHTLGLRYAQFEGGALVRVSVEAPGIARHVLGESDLPTGLSGTAHFRRRSMSLTKEQGLAHLRALNVRYVVIDAGDGRYLPEEQLGLTPIYEQRGVRIYRVPP